MRLDRHLSLTGHGCSSVDPIPVLSSGPMGEPGYVGCWLEYPDSMALHVCCAGVICLPIDLTAWSKVVAVLVAIRPTPIHLS